MHAAPIKPSFHLAQQRSPIVIEDGGGFLVVTGGWVAPGWQVGGGGLRRQTRRPADAQERLRVLSAYGAWYKLALTAPAVEVIRHPAESKTRS
jgi:hypothetical protein